MMKHKCDVSEWLICCLDVGRGRNTDASFPADVDVASLTNTWPEQKKQKQKNTHRHLQHVCLTNVKDFQIQYNGRKWKQKKGK